MATGTVKDLKRNTVVRRGACEGVASVSVGELRSNFKEIEAKLAKGVKVQVTRRGEVVAELQAPAVDVGIPGVKPDYMARLREIWGDTPLDIDSTPIIAEGRGHDGLS